MCVGFLCRGEFGECAELESTVWVAWSGEEQPQAESAVAEGCVPSLKKGREVFTAGGIPHEAMRQCDELSVPGPASAPSFQE